jgi:tetratricopeptide (TPR) repeat protein
MAQHLSDGLIFRYLDQSSTGDDVRPLLRHVLEVCEECRARAAETADSLGLVLTPDLELVPHAVPQAAEYDTVFARVLGSLSASRQRMKEDKLRSGALWARLRPLAPAERVQVIAVEPVFHSWAFLERLLAECVLLRSQPVECHDVATLAVLVADRIDARDVGTSRLADLRSRALAELANAARLNLEFRQAAVYLRDALLLLESGTGDLLEKARVLNYEGSLYIDVGRFEEAAARYARCREIYELLSDRHLMGRSLLQQGFAVGQLEPAEGIELLQHALGLIDFAEEPTLELAARHNLALYLCDAGRTQEAMDVLESSRHLYERFPEPRYLLRLSWLEAKILRGLGRLQDAAFAFDAVRAAFQGEHLDQEYVLASLDLAETLLQIGETVEGVGLLSQIHAWLEAYGMHAEGLGVCLLAREAIARQGVAEETLRNLAVYLKRAWVFPVEDRAF